MIKKIMTVLLVTISVSANANTGIIKAMIDMKVRENLQKEHKSAQVTDNYRLVLFYSTQCPYCVKFAPVVKQYSQYSHIKVEPVSLTNQSLPEFPNTIYATQELIDLAYQGKPVTYPALFVANTKNHTLYPVSFGYLDSRTLDEKMTGLMEKIREYEEKN